MKKIGINSQDYTRVLLTEVLPYEVPMLFSNEGFYKVISSQEGEYFIKKIKSLKNSGQYGIPFDYLIKKNNLGEFRKLSVIHPFNQVAFIEFYSKYDFVILNLCSKSSISLRRPTGIAKIVINQDLVFNLDEDTTKKDDVEVDSDSHSSAVLKSYFIYQPIDLIYKFYERNEYLRLEQKYGLSLEFDINMCFYNIYTHSLSWAIKGKEVAKRHSTKDSFENDFDKLMQLANYNETNGIIVGPEISRIFAEILLQQVDLDVLNFLAEKNIKIGIDFELRRYVDDYFVFSNNIDILKVIENAFSKKLEEYKLFINHSKTNIKKTPFITNIAVGKRELKSLISSFFNSFVKISNTEGVKKIDLTQIKKPYGLSKKIIDEYQCIVQRNNLSYETLSKDVVRNIKQRLVVLFKRKEVLEQKENFVNLLISILDILFYSYSQNLNSSTTFKVSQILVLIYKYSATLNEELKQLVYSKVLRELDFVLSIFEKKTTGNETNIDILNLLIASSIYSSIFMFTEKKLRSLFGEKISGEINDLNYFQIVSMLYYIKNNKNYAALFEEIKSQILNQFKEDADPFAKSEKTMLFFDIICCPYFLDDFRKKLMNVSRFCKSDEYEHNIKKIRQFNNWFMNWNEDIDLERVLKRKEWLPTY